MLLLSDVTKKVKRFLLNQGCRVSAGGVAQRQPDDRHTSFHSGPEV